MYEFNKKQKIIIAIIISIVIITFLYYIYTKEESVVISEEENITEENTENITHNSNEKVKEENETIIVHISGAVKKEGIVELKENSRISDAIDKAEGLKENADLKKINLAFKLEDGMKIYIPMIGENPEEVIRTENEGNIDETSKYITSTSGSGQEKQQGETKEQPNSQNEKVNINTANQTELETLPGIGTSTSFKIIQHREENGDFKSIEEIKEVSGIGDAKFQNIKDLICVK